MSLKFPLQTLTMEGTNRYFVNRHWQVCVNNDVGQEELPTSPMDIFRNALGTKYSAVLLHNYPGNTVEIPVLALEHEPRGRGQTWTTASDIHR